MECFKSLPPDQDEWPEPDKCDDCPYEPNDDYDPGLDEPTPEEMQELAAEEAELGYGEEDYYC